MSSTEPGRYVEVVRAASFREADELFVGWLAAAGLEREQIEDQIRVDTIRALDGSSQRRYLVRESLIPDNRYSE